jgi:hydrogenase 3 maturation protease
VQVQFGSHWGFPVEGLKSKPTATTVGSALEQSLRDIVAGKRTVVVCVGNRLRGDDGLGPLVAQKLRGRLKGTTVIDCRTTPENHILEIVALNPEIVLLVNAIDEGERPGTIVHHEITTQSSKKHTTLGHAIGLADIVHLIRVLSPGRRMRVYLLGVQARSFDRLSGTVRQAADSISQVLLTVEDSAASSENA